MCPTPAGVGASGHSPIGAGGAGGGGENAYGNPEGDSNPYNPPPEGSAGSGSADGSPPNPQTLSRVEKEILVERGELVTRYFKYSIFLVKRQTQRFTRKESILILLGTLKSLYCVHCNID